MATVTITIEDTDDGQFEVNEDYDNVTNEPTAAQNAGKTMIQAFIDRLHETAETMHQKRLEDATVH